MINISIDDLRTDVVVARRTSDVQISRAIRNQAPPVVGFLRRIFRRLGFGRLRSAAPPQTRIVLAKTDVSLPDARQVRDRERLLEALEVTPFGDLAETWSAHEHGDPTHGPFANLWRIHSQYKRVVLIYSWGLAESFIPWAAVWKPQLYRQLLPYIGRIVVIEVVTVVLDDEWRKRIENDRS